MNLLLKTQLVLATAPKINEGKARDLILSYLTPLSNILVWVIPAAALFACLGSLFFWMLKDEDDKERHKPFRMIKRIIIVAIIGESLSAIFVILGIINK